MSSLSEEEEDERIRRNLLNAIRRDQQPWWKKKKKRRKKRVRRVTLHSACGRGAPLGLVEALRKESPWDVQVTDRYGRLPLHRACNPGAFRSASPPVVRLLLDAYPEGARAMERTGCRLPIHNAAWNGAPSEVLTMLLDAHPEGAAAGDSMGRLPVHCFNSQGASPDEEEDVERIEMLIRPLLDDEEACLVNIPWSDGTPLHIAAKFDVLRLHAYVELPRCPPEVIMMVTKQHPGQLRERDDNGNLPLHIAAANPRLNGAKDKGKDLIGELVKLYPEAASASDGEGRFPLVLAIESGKRWDEGVEALADAAEHIATVRDEATNLFPFMLAARVDDACLTTVYSLLRRCPELKRYILD